MDIINTLEKLEPVFIEAGNLAAKMQSTAKHKNKTNTGSPITDIVTEADLAVQEFLLQSFLKTEMVNCHLLAEEHTPTAQKFTSANKYYLAIDPIDGTLRYAKGRTHFGVIVSLHDGKNFLYTFKYFPLLNWTVKIIGERLQTFGETPDFQLPSGTENKIIYYEGNPENTLPDVYKEIIREGLGFDLISNVSDDISGNAMLMCGKVAGFYHENFNVYDGFVDLHFAQATKKLIYSNWPDNKPDLNIIKKRASGLYYPGCYLVLNKSGR